MEKTACPSSYVVVDLETTGLYPSQDRILEIGAVKVLDGEVADTFCMFADPQMKIPEKIRELTGITQEMVAGQPTPAEAVRAFLDFCGELDLMGHNLIFDYSFLKHQAADQKIVLFHDCYAASVEAALRCADELKARGYEFVTVDRLILAP